MKNNKIFEIGDRVFDIRCGWGVVVELYHDDFNPIGVEFKIKGVRHIHYYTRDGKISVESLNPILSFTEYTLDGFSQERPKIYIFNPNTIPTMSYNEMDKLIDENNLPTDIEIPTPEFIDTLRDLGHIVKIRMDDGNVYDFQELTDRELRNGHNFCKIWRGGGFSLNNLNR